MQVIISRKEFVFNSYILNDFACIKFYLANVCYLRSNVFSPIVHSISVAVKYDENMMASTYSTSFDASKNSNALKPIVQCMAVCRPKQVNTFYKFLHIFSRV